MRTGYAKGICGTKPNFGTACGGPGIGTRRRVLGIAGIGALAAFPPVAWAGEPGAWFEVAGRMHPMMVHFPIALLAAACVFEVLRVVSGRERPSAPAVGCLVLAVLGACAAGVTGWMHAEFAGRAGESETEIHRWVAIGGSGVGLMALVLALSALVWSRRSVRRLYVLCLLVGAASVGVAGHLGGELTFGAGYVFEPLEPDAEPRVRTGTPGGGESLVSFERDVLPIFRGVCIECHGQRKQSGKLRLDSAAELESSRHFGEVIVAGDPGASLLVELISLPPDDHDIMPRRGDPLSRWQIETIRRWIADGAVFDAVESAGPGAAGEGESESEGSPDSAAGVAPELEHRLGEVIAAVRARGGHASLVASGVPLLVVNYSIAAPPLTDRDIALLSSVGELVVELNAGGVGVSDGVVAQIGRLSGLRRLNISRSPISDDALGLLTGLSGLEVLNVYGCPIGAGSVDAIAGLGSLRRVYLWQTGMDDEAVRRLRELRPGLEVVTGDEEASEPAPEEAPSAPAEGADTDPGGTDEGDG